MSFRWVDLHSCYIWFQSERGALERTIPQYSHNKYTKKISAIIHPMTTTQNQTQKPIPIADLITNLIESTEIHIPTTLTDPLLISIYRNEMLVLQRIVKQMVDSGRSPSPDWISGILLGFETAFRRIQDIHERGLKDVYRENFIEKP